MTLNDYSRKRDFVRTPEPQAALAATAGNRFVVQRHQARRLHYDLRLEIGGALKSWAVPKGPTLDPKQKRLAVQVEDHPLEYGDFEGTIPAGNYGAGVVSVWDSGSFEMLGEPTAEQQLARGDFKFQLHGNKLMGNFALVRMKSSKKNEWLLLKKPDFAAQDGWNAEDHLEPVRSRSADLSLLAGAKRAAMPDRVEPMLATLAGAVPEGGEWGYEIKWDGYRGLCYVAGGKLRIESRNGHLLNRQFPELEQAAIAADAAIIDGEIVAYDANGRPSFSLMQQRTGFAAAEARSRAPVALVAFDLLYLNGYDLRDVVLSERSKLLRSVVRAGKYLRISESFTGSGEQVLQAAREHGLEGVVAKRLDSKYESGRSRSWVKVKFVTQQEFVICGYTSGRRKPFSSLVLGYHDNDTLTWAGNVGTGFTEKSLAEIYPQLEKLASKKSLFALPPEVGDVTWVAPKLVCSVRYSGWGADNHLRAPVFVGLRPDLEARACVRESPAMKSDAPADDKLLPAGKTEAILQIGGRTLKFTNLKKVFYPADGYTKRDLINYYHDVAPLLVPHLAGRPLSLKRYPNGIAGDYFFQKDAPKSFPPWLHTEEIAGDKDAAAKHYVICDDEATLLYLANLGCIDQNPWYSRVGTLDYPDFIVLDLDPYFCGFDRIVEAAQLVRRKLADLELEAYPKTTGGDGMHLYVPIAAAYSYEQVRTFAEIVARLVIAERPQLFTTPRAVTQREKGRVYFDYLQIAWGKTISAPYVLRAHDKAPVATPLRWGEVRPGLSPLDFTLANVRARFQHLGDIFAPVLANSQRLETSMERLEKLVHGPK
jgi:bifunctional non-homologous end joining protein LigD